MDTRTEDVGVRIRRARQARGVGQEALADAIGATKSTVSKIEAGTRKVEGGELADIASFLGVSMRDLLGRRQPLAPLALANRLAAADRGSPTSVEACRQVRHLLELEAMLDELEIPTANPPPFETLVPSTSQPVQAGHEAASRLRDRLGLGEAPASDLPALLEDQVGVDILAVPLGDGEDAISGMCVRSGDARIAVVNSSKSGTHQRFTLAHELAHLAFDDLDDEALVDDSVGAGSTSDPREVRANAFAAAFLLPEGAITRLMGGRGADEASFAHALFTFDVSAAALANRLDALGVGSASDRDRWRELSPRTLALKHNRVEEGRRSVAARDQLRSPTRLYRRALAAYRDGRIGVGPLAGLLGRNDDELVRELAEAGLAPDLTEDADVLELL